MGMCGVTYLPIAEFRRLGYLQELNRQFLHPLGLAMEVVIDHETGEESLGGVWDARSDPEGIRFDAFDEERARCVCQEQKARAETRRRSLGYVIQGEVV